MTAAQFRTVQQPLDPTTAVGEIALFDADGNPLDLSGGGQKITSVKSHRARRRHGSHRDTRQWGVDHRHSGRSQRRSRYGRSRREIHQPDQGHRRQHHWRHRDQDRQLHHGHHRDHGLIRKERPPCQSQTS